jgi:hypothetical protein
MKVDLEKLTEKIKNFQTFKVTEQVDIEKKKALKDGEIIANEEGPTGSVFKVFKSQLGMVKLR